MCIVQPRVLTSCRRGRCRWRSARLCWTCHRTRSLARSYRQLFWSRNAALPVSDLRWIACRRRSLSWLASSPGARGAISRRSAVSRHLVMRISYSNDFGGWCCSERAGNSVYEGQLFEPRIKLGYMYVRSWTAALPPSPCSTSLRKSRCSCRSDQTSAFSTSASFMMARSVTTSVGIWASCMSVNRCLIAQAYALNVHVWLVSCYVIMTFWQLHAWWHFVHWRAYCVVVKHKVWIQ